MCRQKCESYHVCNQSLLVQTDPGRHIDCLGLNKCVRNVDSTQLKQNKKNVYKKGDCIISKGIITRGEKTHIWAYF